jgi:hypothetical protein
VANSPSPESISPSTSQKVRARLQVLDERLARLRTARDRLAALASRAERRRDTRRKIVLGGTVLAAVEHEGVPSLRTHSELLRWLDRQLQRPQDRRAFDLAPRKAEPSARSSES